MSENYKYLGLGLYKISNQNGLKGLIKSKSDNGDEYYESYKGAINRGLTSYPKHYPVIVTVVDAYFGFHFPQVKVYKKTDLGGIMCKLQDVLDEF